MIHFFSAKGLLIIQVMFLNVTLTNIISMHILKCMGLLEAIIKRLTYPPTALRV